jgi:hypothetical protein
MLTGTYTYTYILVPQIQKSKKKTLLLSMRNSKYFDSLALKPLALYVILLGHFVANSQPFNLVRR